MLDRGSSGAIVWVLVVTLLLGVVGGVVFWLLDFEAGGRGSLGESMWRSLLIAVGEGGVGDGGWVERSVTLGFVLLSLLLAGLLIGLLVAVVNRRLALLRSGRSAVVETGHTLVLGWSHRLVPLLLQMLDDEDRTPIVVLTGRDTATLEDELRATLGGRRPSRRVVFRTGDPSRRSDLAQVNLGAAASVIVLNQGSAVDALAVRRALAADAFDEVERLVVAEISNPRVARSLADVAGDRVQTVSVETVVADILAQACRMPGVAAVFEALLRFDGDELYVWELDGTPRPFSTFVTEDDHITPLGIVRPDGDVLMAPAPSTLVTASDRAVVLADGDATPHRRSATKPTPEDWVLAPPDPGDARRVVVIGWSDVGALLVERLAAQLPRGSQVHVLADHGTAIPTVPVNGDEAVTFSVGHTTHDPAEVIAAVGSGTHTVVVLPYQNHAPPDEADARTLLTTLTLSRARETGRIGPVHIAAQILSEEAVQVRGAVRSDDLVVTDALASRLLVRVSRDLELARAFSDLFDAGGPIIAARPAWEVVPHGRQPYGAVVDRCALAGDVVIGVIVAGELRLNPPKSDTFRFHAGDRVLVVTRRRSAPRSGARSLLTPVNGHRVRREPRPDVDTGNLTIDPTHALTAHPPLQWPSTDEWPAWPSD